MTRTLRLATALAALTALTGCDALQNIGTSRAYNYAVVHHASSHINASREFEEFNPGLGIGSEAPIMKTSQAIGVEAGRYRNSEGDNSSYAVGYWETDLLRNAPRRLRVGAFLGMAEYPDEVNRTSLPTIGDFITVGGLQATISTFGAHEFRFRAAPGLRQSDAIITLQSNFKF